MKSNSFSNSDKSIYQAIQEKYSISEIAENLGIRLKKGRSDSIAPDGGGKNAFTVYEKTGRWYDFKLGIGGDIIDLVAYLKYDGNNRDALRELVPPEYRDKLDKSFKDEDLEQEYISRCFEFLQKQELPIAIQALEYLNGRKIKLETIQNQKIGNMKRLSAMQ